MTRQQKVFILSGKPLIKSKDALFLGIGIIGAIITLFGLIKNPSQAYFVAGSCLLLITSTYYRLFFFMALEIILIAGHGAIMLGIGSILQLAIPTLLCLQLLFFYYLSGQKVTIFLLIGIVGIATLSVGFAYENQWIFFSGSIAIALYAFYSAKTNRAALLWGFLNGFFALLSLIKITFLR